ncbi:MAG: hypothetical protein ACFFD2_18280 [Promethearchaeota archaeon]
MIEHLLDKHYIIDANIEAGFRKVSMEDFLPLDMWQYAYLDQPLPFHQNGRPMAAPHINAIFLQLLQLDDESYQILQLSSMSGYFAALTAEITRNSQIRIVEGDPEIITVLQENLKRSGYNKIEVIEMDPIKALQKFPQSNRIIFCGAVSSSIIDEIANEMPNDSILIAPVFSRPILPIDQDMIRVIKSSNGEIKMESFGKVSFIMMQSASFMDWASKTQQLIFDQIGKSLEEYFTTTLPREEPLLHLNVPEHIMEDFFTANTLIKKDFKKAAIFHALLAVKASIQYFIDESLDFSGIDYDKLRILIQEVLTDEEMRNFETLLDIERSIINFDYKRPPDLEALARMALDIASNFLESRFKKT